MSNYLAIATVTASLAQLLSAVGSDVSGATVTHVRPDGAEDATPTTGVNLYLFQVTPNASWRNSDLPTRDANGRLVQRPRAALDLHYLLTFYGNESQLEPQRLLGSVVRTLHAKPVLTPQNIRDTIRANPFLATSDLADAIETIKFTPMALSLEELSKLWSVFFQTPYTLSVAYQGTVVLIESEESPQRALPVRARNLYVETFRQPMIEDVASAAGANDPIVVGSTLLVHGRQLRGDETRLLLGGSEVTPEDVTDRQIRLPLSSPPVPAGALRAGVQSVQVVHKRMLGTPPEPHRGVESNVAPFVLRPTIQNVQITSVGGGGDGLQAEVTVDVTPTIGQRQRVTLLLNEMTEEAPAAYSFVAAPRTADSPSITIPIRGVDAGQYLVRIQVDGAESVLDVAQNQYTGPTVEVS
jgi:hypothetical protein